MNVKGEYQTPEKPVSSQKGKSLLFWGKRGDNNYRGFKYLNLSVCCN